MSRFPQWATELAIRISETWPRGGPSIQVWEEELAELDEGRAGTAYVRLRRSERSAPSIALFFATYHSVESSDASTRGPVCMVCDGAGWVESREMIRVPNRAPVSQVEPCRSCPLGREMQAVHRRILAKNLGTAVVVD